MASAHVTVYPQALSWHLQQSLAGVHEVQLDNRMHANRRVLIILALEVLGQADLVGTPVEYDKVAPTMQHPNSAGAPQQYLNGQGAAPPDVWSSKCPSHPAPAQPALAYPSALQLIVLKAAWCWHSVQPC